MKKTNLIFIFLFLPLCVLGQDVNRVLINGQVSAPVGNDVEGISIYNISAQEGTVTLLDGSFEIAVSLNDRILVTALQFQKFTVIVDQGVIDNKRMAIYLNPTVNTLDEVIVRPYDFSGNIKADIARIKVVDFDSKLDLSYEALEYDYNFTDDAQTKVRGNTALSVLNPNQFQYGFSPLGFLDLFLKSKEKKAKLGYNNLGVREAMATALRQRYSVFFYESEFGIDPLKVDDFIYFVDDNGLTQDLLKLENEIQLLSFLQKQSEVYKSRARD